MKKIDKLMQKFYEVVKQEYELTKQPVKFREVVNKIPNEYLNLVKNPIRAIDHQLRNKWKVFTKIKKGRDIYLIPEELDIIRTKIEAKKEKKQTISRKKFSELSKEIIDTPIKDFIKKADFISLENVDEDEVVNIIKDALILTLSNVLVKKIVIVRNNIEKFKELTEKDLDYVIYYDDTVKIVDFEKLYKTVEGVAKNFNIEVEVET